MLREYVSGTGYNDPYYTTHMNTVHSLDNVQHVCPRCQKPFNEKQSLKRHLKIHQTNREKYPCQECKREFTQKWGLKIHMKTHDPNRPSISCPKCKAVLTDKGVLRHHMRTVHAPDHIKYVCPKCQKCFKEKGTLRKHMVAHGKVKEKCSECNAELYDIKRHMERNHGESANKTFTCLKCPRNFSYESSLTRHMKHFHSDERPSFTCHLCNNSFAFKHTLQRHIRERHATERIFPCTLCNKAFPSSRRLKDHLEIHKANRQQLCKWCGKMYFHLESHLRYHQKKGKKIPIVKKRDCPKCKKQINVIYPGSFKRHMQSHIHNYKLLRCKLCPRTFRDKKSLRYHLSIHKGTCETTCSICNRRVMHIKIHMETHKNWNERKLYSCVRCDRKFKEKSSLQHHIAKHDGTNKKFCRICNEQVVRMQPHMKSKKHLRNLRKEVHPKANFQLNFLIE